MSDTYKPWIVLYVRGGRFASFPLTDENLADIRRQVYYIPIQTDINGTQHWNVIGPKKGYKAKASRQSV